MSIMSYKEVFYCLYCRKCKYEKTPEVEDPCNECLTVSHREHSHTPIRFEEVDSKNGGRV